MGVYADTVTNLRSITATINGHYTIGDNDPRQGRFEYYGPGLPGTLDVGKYPCYSGENVSHDIGVGYPYYNLQPDKTYYYRFGVVISGEYVWSGWASFKTKMVVVAVTLQATAILYNRATLWGSFTKDNEGIGSIGFEYKKGIDGGVTRYNYWMGWPPGTYEWDLTGLDPDQIYYYRFAVDVQFWGTVYGAWYSFITGPISKAVTKDATQIFNLKATLNGQVIVGGDGCSESGFEWKKGEEGAIQTEVVLDYGGADYNVVINNLSQNTLYFFRARGKRVSIGYFYGDWLYFTTTSIIPTVSTQLATDIDSFSVTGNGTVVDCGGEEPHCIKKGFEVTYSFSGTLEEYNAWKSHGFTGDVIFDSVTGLWEGTLTKSYEESGTFSTGAFTLSLDDLICDKEYSYRARAKNTAGWGYGSYLTFTTNDLLLRKSCTCGIFTIMLCAYVKPIPSGSVIKRRGFRWGKLISAEEYDIHEDGNFSASATIGPVDTINFVKSNDDNVYDTIVDPSGGFLTAGFVAGKFINVSATGVIDPVNEGKFKIISVIAGTITVNVRNTLVSETVTGVTIVDLFALYIVDLDPETIYYGVAYIAIEDNLGVWTVQEGNVTGTTTIVNIFDFEGYDKVEFYKPEREQNYKKITRKIGVEIIAEQYYIDKAGGRRVLDIPNHLIQTKEKAVEIGTNYKNRFQEIKSLMGIEFPTPAPFQREDTLDIGFGRIRFKENGKGVVNFMPDGEGLMLFRYRMVMLIRKTDMDYTISKDNVDYMATMELEEA